MLFAAWMVRGERDVCLVYVVRCASRAHFAYAVLRGVYILYILSCCTLTPPIAPVKFVVPLTWPSLPIFCDGWGVLPF